MAVPTNLRDKSHATAQRAFTSGSPNGKALANKCRRCHFFIFESTDIPLESTDPRILHVDDALIVISKPSGMLSVPGRGPDKQDCAFLRIKETFSDTLIVHRLDMGTSGILLFARGMESLRRLSRQFETRQVHKRYTAIVRGCLPAEHGEINLPLLTDWERRPRQKVDHDAGKPALTRYTVRHYDAVSRRSQVDLKPVTGRTHQLRVHLAALGTPIVGDPLYGTDEEREAGLTGVPTHPDFPRLMLHAEELAILHPMSGLPVQWNDPAPF